MWYALVRIRRSNTAFSREMRHTTGEIFHMEGAFCSDKRVSYTSIGSEVLGVFLGIISEYICNYVKFLNSNRRFYLIISVKFNKPRYFLII